MLDHRVLRRHRIRLHGRVQRDPNKEEIEHRIDEAPIVERDRAVVVRLLDGVVRRVGPAAEDGELGGHVAVDEGEEGEEREEDVGDEGGDDTLEGAGDDEAEGDLEDVVAPDEVCAWNVL